MSLQIMDETELTRVIVCKQRSYVVPKDVADERDELVAALRKLTNEVGACMGMAHDVVRHAVGNTNFACLELRVAEASAILAKVDAA